MSDFGELPPQTISSEDYKDLLTLSEIEIKDANESTLRIWEKRIDDIISGDLLLEEMEMKKGDLTKLIEQRTRIISQKLGLEQSLPKKKRQ